jgi:hypothetical protein
MNIISPIITIAQIVWNTRRIFFHLTSQLDHQLVRKYFGHLDVILVLLLELQINKRCFKLSHQLVDLLLVSVYFYQLFEAGINFFKFILFVLVYPFNLLLIIFVFQNQIQIGVCVFRRSCLSELCE